MRNSIALRLALMFALAALGGFAVIGVALDQVLQRELARHQREEVQGRLQDVRYMLEHGRSSELARLARDKIQAQTSADGRVRFWMWSEDPAYRYGADAGQMTARAIEGLGAEAGGVIELPASAESGAGAGSAGAGRGRMALLGVALPANDIRPALRLAVGVDAGAFTRTRRAFELALLLLTLAGGVLVAALGYWIARVGLRPLSRMSAQAQRIGPDNRERRLRLSALPRELLHLGQSFNAAFDRLDAAYRQLETFNADVAHELRTPLANLIGQTQVTLARERPAQALREVLQSNLEELERLRAIVADMLFLARAEQGERASRLADASLAGEVGKTVEFLDLLLDEAGLSVRVSGDAVAPIEKALFRRALTNLLQNAIQHSPPGAEIAVNITREARRATVSISNPSDPIAPEQLARLFDRFYRIDDARRNSGESHGLGLSIVKAVAIMHQGEVFARAEGGQITVGLSVALPG